jgi:hypothetical protein
MSSRRYLDEPKAAIREPGFLSEKQTKVEKMKSNAP